MANWDVLMNTDVPPGRCGLTDMRWYVDFDLLSSDAGPSGAVYVLLRRAGYRPVLEYVSRREPHGRSGGVPPPVLVTDGGEVIAGLSRIMSWIADAPAESCP